MRVIDLIEILKKLPPDDVVKTWGSFQDEETDLVYVSTDGAGIVYIMDSCIGYPSINPIEIF